MAHKRPPAQRILLLIGSLGPLGHCPASGTVTVAVLGVPLFWLLHQWTVAASICLIVVITAASVWIHQVGDRILGEKDSRRLVWDEIVGFLIAIVGLPFTPQVAVVVFLLERAIDIVKIPPAPWIERTWSGGWGDVGDDVTAGLYACGIMHLLLHYFGPAFGVGS